MNGIELYNPLQSLAVVVEYCWALVARISQQREAKKKKKTNPK